MTNSFYWGEKQTLLLLIIIIIIVIFIFIIFVGVDVAAGGGRGCVCVRWVCPQSVYTQYSQDDAEFWLDDGRRLVSTHRSLYFFRLSVCCRFLTVRRRRRRQWGGRGHVIPPPSVTHSLPGGSLWSGSKSTGGWMRLDVEAPGRREDANSTCRRARLSFGFGLTR